MISRVRAPRLDLLVDLVAQVDGELGVRVGDGLVLADEAAQFRGEPDGALLRDRIGRRGLRVLGLRGDAAGQQQRDQHGSQRAHDCFSSSRTSGRIFFSSTSGVTGPICLKRITPCLSMRKVSGTP